MAVTQMSDDWLREIDDKKIVGAVLLEFSVAFIKIMDHSLLLEKVVLWLYTSCYSILWIKSYLSNRRQGVFFNGSLSNIIQAKSGIPQGSCLSLFFNLY
jgi:hypothetical protein